MIIRYTDIGHSDPKDTLWLLQGAAFESVSVGAGGGRPLTHEGLWGGEANDYWHGRYDVATGFCSIVPPHEETNYKRPPAALLEILKSHFSVVRFYFFSRGVESWSPNPRKGRRSEA